MSGVWGAVTLVGIIIIIGLLLRYGRSSISLASIGTQSLSNSLADLTLKGGGYSYYGPSEG
jgi:hypothetical protein